jgi:LacI family transcriptional regulator
MIISPACKSDIYEKEIEDLNCVFVDNAPYANGKPYSFISIDNKKAAYELTQKAIDCGHKDIALIIGELEETSSKERYLGFKRCMQDNGLKVQKNRVYKGNSHFESGYKITKRLIEKRELPTCIFAHNGVEAHGVLLALKEANIRVPENISVICFDGEDNTKLIEPELTGMVQPVEEIGKIAVEMIIGNLEKSSENKTRVHLLDYYFAEGNSLAHI